MFARPILYALNEAEQDLAFRVEPADEKGVLSGLSSQEIGVAKWVRKNNKHAGATTNTLPGFQMAVFSVRGTQGVMGIVGTICGLLRSRCV